MKKLLILFISCISINAFAIDLDEWQIELENKLITVKAKSSNPYDFRNELKKIALKNNDSHRAKYILHELENESFYDTSSLIDALYKKKNKQNRIFSGLFPCIHEIKNFSEDTFQDEILNYIENVTYSECVSGTILENHNFSELNQFNKLKNKYLFSLKSEQSNYLKKKFADELGAFENEYRIVEKIGSKYIDLFDRYGVVIPVTKYPKTYEDARVLIGYSMNDAPSDYKEEFHAFQKSILDTNYLNILEFHNKIFFNRIWHKELSDFFDFKNKWIFKLDNVEIDLKKRPKFKNLNLEFLKDTTKAIDTSKIYDEKIKSQVIKLNSFFNSNKFSDTLKREVEINYSFERFYFAINSLKAHLKNNQSPESNISQAKTCSNESKFEFSIKPLRPGDLNKSCSSLIENAIDLGFKKISFFYPIPYSGAHNIGYSIKKDEIPEYHTDYKFEDVGLISNEELFSCLDKIDQAKLKLNWIPHLESIITLNKLTPRESRVFSEIPLDHHYFKRAYTPLIDYLKANPNAFSETKIKTTLSAETELGLFRFAKSALKTEKSIREEFANLNKSVEVSLNTMSNFDHLKKLSDIMDQNKCDDLNELLKNVDRLSPSVNEEQNQIINNSFKKTRKNYLNNLNSILKKICPTNDFTFLKSKKFSIGDLKLNDKDSLETYISFQNELDSFAKKRKDSDASISLMNSAKWQEDTNFKKDSELFKNMKKVVGRCE